ncbi:hypothetical protein Tsubulata_002822 [Turnera subulata]|uniref:CDT1 Geminin-binding domain-containing protein n=1 Tax=Turnera subulata TaxID=218843 RepID=A0A9Q0IYX3_9ROSI|nr:hypothetical protein Tsubulata_002822 [Turnera subulata]
MPQVTNSNAIPDGLARVTRPNSSSGGANKRLSKLCFPKRIYFLMEVNSNYFLLPSPERNPYRIKTPQQKTAKPPHQWLPGPQTSPLPASKMSVEPPQATWPANLPGDGSFLGRRTPPGPHHPPPSATPALPHRKSNPRVLKRTSFPKSTLVEFFNCLDTSIRLLRIRGTMSTFSNISPQIQSLTNRTFTYVHLAQLKYILPEAIELEKISLFDERTCCMKPDLLVTIDVNGIECDEKTTKSEITNVGLSLRKLFRGRIAKFYEDHPEGDDIPQEMLPEPFNRKQQGLCQAIMTGVPYSSSSGINDTPIDELRAEPVAPAPASHLSRSSRRSFSNKVFSSKVLNDPTQYSSVDSLSVGSLIVI